MLHRENLLKNILESNKKFLKTITKNSYTISVKIIESINDEKNNIYFLTFYNKYVILKPYQNFLFIVAISIS